MPASDAERGTTRSSPTRTRPGRNPLTERLEARVPRWYRPVLQWSGNMLALAAFAAVLWFLRPQERVPGWAWLSVPFGILFASGVEYVLHRFPMHKRMKGLDRFFRRHTLLHHRFFDHATLEMQGPREGYFVLTNLHVAAISTLMLSAAYFIMRGAVGIHAATLGAVSMTLYAMLAETMHVSYHLNGRWQRKFPFNMGWFQFLRELHRDHHNPRSMREYNFAIGLPIWDLLLGTFRIPPALEPETTPELEPAASHTQLHP